MRMFDACQRQTLGLAFRFMERAGLTILKRRPNNRLGIGMTRPLPVTFEDIISFGFGIESRDVGTEFPRNWPPPPILAPLAPTPYRETQVEQFPRSRTALVPGAGPRLAPGAHWLRQL